MINVVLTTEVGKDEVHAWAWLDNKFTERILSLVPTKSIAILLGRAAQGYRGMVRSTKVIEHIHPAARNMDFNSKDIFGETNAGLKKWGFSPINWTPGNAQRPVFR